MRFSTFFVIVSIMLSTLWVDAQEIVSVTYAREYTTTQANIIKFAIGLTVPIEHNVDIYKVLYTTTGSDMNLDTASGLFMLPSGINRPMPIACYQHGTTTGRSDVPSNLRAFYEMGVLLATNGIAVVAPDYLGMGSSRGFHPYVHAETEATAAVDLIRALQTYMSEEELTWNQQLFITGYSQGGHAAMALHQYIEEEIPDEMQVTASLPMSGPYSLSGVMLGLAYGEEEFNFPSYLVYSARGLKEIYPDLYDQESDLYKEEFLPEIIQFTSTGEGTSELNLDLIDGLLTRYGTVQPKLIYRDSILNVFQTQPDHPFNRALAESDVYDWTPKAPVYMLYCEGDDQVPFRNTIIADSVMNARGAQDVRSMEVSGGRNLDHSQCAIPALNEGIPWLLSFIQTTPTIDLISIADLSIAPNPADISFQLINGSTVTRMDISDMSGRRIVSLAGGDIQQTISTSQWTDGMYLLYLYTDAGLDIRKLIVHH